MAIGKNEKGANANGKQPPARRAKRSPSRLCKGNGFIRRIVIMVILENRLVPK